MGEQEPNIPVSHISQERIDSLSPERRAQLEQAATVFNAAPKGHHRDPYFQKLAQSIAESFTTDMGNFLTDIQDSAERNRHEP